MSIEERNDKPIWMMSKEEKKELGIQLIKESQTDEEEKDLIEEVCEISDTWLLENTIEILKEKGFVITKQ